MDLICDPPMLHATKPLGNEARRQRLVLLLERQQQLSQQSTMLELRLAQRDVGSRSSDGEEAGDPIQEDSANHRDR